jgi:hypothetical protein
MESCTPLPFAEDDVGRRRTTPIPGTIFRWDLRWDREKRNSIREDLSLHGSPPKEAVAEQNEAMSEGKHRVYSTKGERGLLFSPAGFLYGSSEKDVG